MSTATAVASSADAIDAATSDNELDVMAEILAVARHLGVTFNGDRWTGIDGVAHRVLRQEVDRLGLAKPGTDDEAIDDDDVFETEDGLDPVWEERALRDELRRRRHAREVVERRFFHACNTVARQPVYDGRAATVAKLVEAELPITEETVAWVESLPDIDVLDVKAHVSAEAVRGSVGAVRSTVKRILLAKSRDAALASEPLDLSRPVYGVALTDDAARAILGTLTPQAHQRAFIKRCLTRLWLRRAEGQFPERCPDERMAKAAWLTFVGFATPPVFTDARRWNAKRELRTVLEGTGIEPTQLEATLAVARKLAIGDSIERAVRALM